MAGRRSACRRACLVAALLPSCGERVRGDGTLGDVPLVLAMRARVVADGPYAEDLRAPPPERWRAEILPGDEVQVEALVASAAGELDLDAQDALWFLALGSACVYSAGRAVDAEHCSASDHVVLPCVVGRGAAPRFIAPATFEVYDQPIAPLLGAQLCLVVGVRRSTEDCAAFLETEGAGFHPSDCAIASIPIPYGPLLRLLELHDELPPEVDPDRIPPAHTLDLLTPDAGPGVGAVTFEVDEPGDPTTEPPVVPEGETVIVPVGGRLDIERTSDPRDEQLYIREQDGWFVGVRETVRVAGWYVGHPGAYASGWDQASLWVPSEPTTFSLWVTVTDDHRNMSWARWTVEVVP